MKNLFRTLGAMLLIAGTCLAQNFPGASGNPSILSRPGGIYYAPAFTWSGHIVSGNATTGSVTVVIGSSFKTPDGSNVPVDAIAATLTPILVDWGQGNQETVTPTTLSVATCPIPIAGESCLSVTGTFNNLHGASLYPGVLEGTFGAQTAVNLAQRYSGGTVIVDAAWAQMGGTSAMLAALTPYQGVAINDNRSGVGVPWRPLSNATFAAVPATLTATTVGFGLNGAATTGGTYTGTSTYHVCVSYVDLMGNEGPCSLDFSGLTAGTGAVNQIGFAAPAASAGMVGYVPYISLASGTYALAYRVPLTSTVCRLTSVETVIAACALTNATYNQTGAAAVVSALTVNTARLAAQLGAASTTADIVSNSGAHTAYLYGPAGDSGVPIASYAPFTVTTAAATTVPAILGTIQLPAGFMNFVGKTIRVCGKATQASAGSTATVETIQLVWDADGSNTTGAGVIIGSGETLTSTMVTGNADTYNFCETIRTAVSGAGATACSIQDTSGWLIVEGAQTATSNRAGANLSVGTTGSLNCAGEARIDVQYVHTTNTDGAGLILQGATVEVLN